MPTFRAPDGAELAYHRSGEGGPLICLPGGPMHDSAYLGDLGGLSARRELIRLDLRGTGQSSAPAGPESHRVDHLVADVEALRAHLGLDRIDVLGHSAGASLAVLYAIRHPQRVSRLALIAPSTRAVGLDATVQMRQEIVDLRQGEPWFPEAAAVWARIAAGQGSASDWAAIAPFSHGRWDAAAQALQAAGQEQEEGNPEAAGHYYADGAFDPDAVRAVLAAFRPPVLLLAGELDIGTCPRLAEQFAALFPAARLAVQPGAGHFPWLDDPARLVATITGFLDEPTQT
jgi:pimeloyl-ACP methyl ester carboxylesterase